MTNEDRNIPELPEMPPEEERRQTLLATKEIPPILKRALDRIDDGWALLWVQHELSRLGDPAARRRTAAHKPGTGLRHDLLRATQADVHLEYLKGKGMGFDFEDGRLTLESGGGRPRSLYRQLIEALDEELQGESLKLSRAEKIRRMSSLLKPFFSPTLTSTGTKDLLARTYDNV